MRGPRPEIAMCERRGYKGEPDLARPLPVGSAMSALNTPDDGLQPHQQPQDAQHLQGLPDGLHPDQVSPPGSEGTRKAKAPSVRRACAACHSGKTRCSEVLPCQSCLKRGLGSTCAYPDPDAADAQGHSAAQQQQVPYAGMQYAAPPMHSLAHPNGYYDYSTFSATAPPPAAPNTTPTPAAAVVPAASSSTFRPSKRPRPLTDEEAAAITRNFQRGAFFIGQSEPIRIDPRLPVRLTLAEGDQVHFLIGETAFQPMA